ELVHERDLWFAREDRIDVHLAEGRAAVLDLPPRDAFEVADLRSRVLAAVRLDEPDDDVRAARTPPTAFVEHRVGLAYARGGSKVDAERATRHRSLRLNGRVPG